MSLVLLDNASSSRGPTLWRMGGEGRDRRRRDLGHEEVRRAGRDRRMTYSA